MNIPTDANSRFMQKKDLPAPVLVLMSHVTYDEKINNPHILHFDPAAKLRPLPLCLTNRRALVAAFGEDTELLRGRTIELYVDHGVTNSTGQMVGGIRLRAVEARVPNRFVAATALPVLPPAPRPAPQPVPSPAPQPTRPAAAPLPASAPAGNRYNDGDGNQRTLPELSVQLCKGFDAAQSKGHLDAWAKWGKRFPFDGKQQDLHEDRYNVALDRLAEAAAIARSRDQKSA